LELSCAEMGGTQLRTTMELYIYMDTIYIYRRRDPERGLQSWFRPAKPETRNPKPTVKVGFELRNPKPETDSEDLPSPGPIETRNPKPETEKCNRFSFGVEKNIEE